MTPRESSRTWTSVASSSDGTKLLAAVNNGQLYTSIDSGVSWTPPTGTAQWISVASSADGTKLLAAVSGGQLYTSNGTSGGQGSTAALQYLGNNLWTIVEESHVAAGAIDTPQLAANAVSSANIAAGAVTNTQLAANAVSSANIAAGAVTNTQLANNSVATADIQTGAITSVQLAPSSVGSAQLANSAVTSASIASGAVTNTQLASNAVATANIQNAAVTSVQLAFERRRYHKHRKCSGDCCQTRSLHRGLDNDRQQCLSLCLLRRHLHECSTASVTRRQSQRSERGNRAI